jgi:hypothetical protein
MTHRSETENANFTIELKKSSAYNLCQFFSWINNELFLERINLPDKMRLPFAVLYEMTSRIAIAIAESNPNNLPDDHPELRMSKVSISHPKD